MQNTVVDLADFPQKLVQEAMKASGKRAPRVLVRRALEVLAASASEEPMTPEQCRQTFRKGHGAIHVTPQMKALGLDESFFR